MDSVFQVDENWVSRKTSPSNQKDDWEPTSPPKFKFLKLTAEEVQRFLSCSSSGSSRDVLVYMLVTNALRVSREEKLAFTPRWRQGVQIARKTLTRSLKRLHEWGLLVVEFRTGKSPIVQDSFAVKTPPKEKAAEKALPGNPTAADPGHPATLSYGEQFLMKYFQDRQS